MPTASASVSAPVVIGCTRPGNAGGPMDAISVNYELLSRLRVALDREMAVAVGLASQIIDATRDVSSAHVRETEAGNQLLTWPDRRAGGMTVEEMSDAINAQLDARAFNVGRCAPRSGSRAGRRCPSRSCSTMQRPFARLAEIRQMPPSRK
jgi:hypothetical protein